MCKDSKTLKRKKASALKRSAPEKPNGLKTVAISGLDESIIADVRQYGLRKGIRSFSAAMRIVLLDFFASSSGKSVSNKKRLQN